MFLTSYWLLSQLCEFLYFLEVQGKGRWLGPLLTPDSGTAVLRKLANVGTELGLVDQGGVCHFQDTNFLWPKPFLFSRMRDLPMTRHKALDPERV